MAFSVEPAKVAILAMLQARPGLAGVLVTRGTPTRAVTERERIYISTTDGVSRSGPPSHGTGTEVNMIHLLVEVVGVAGGTHAEAEGRMWEIADEIDAQTKADPEWGVALCGSWLTLVGEHTAVAPDKHFVSRGLLRLHTTQRM